jgi:hypothetical protein
MRPSTTACARCIVQCFPLASRSLRPQSPAGEKLFVAPDEGKRGFTHKELHTKILEKDVKVVLWAGDPEADPGAPQIALRGPKTLRQVLQQIEQSLVPALRRCCAPDSGVATAATAVTHFRTDIRNRMPSLERENTSPPLEREGVIIGLSELPGRRLEYLLEVQMADETSGVATPVAPLRAAGSKAT